MLLPGRAVLEVPGPGTPLVHLRADMLGVVDVPGKRITVDAALVDSQVLGYSGSAEPPRRSWRGATSRRRC